VPALPGFPVVAGEAQLASHIRQPPRPVSVDKRVLRRSMAMLLRKRGAPRI
jgi:hypothetical protein